MTMQSLADLEDRIYRMAEARGDVAAAREVIPSLTPEERLAVLEALRRHAAADTFGAVMAFAVRPSLSDEDYRELASELGIAA